MFTFDAAFAIPNLVAEGAGDADPLWGLLTADLPTVQADALTATLACMVGCYAREALRESLPGLRAHQRTQAEVTAQWFLARVLRRPVHAFRARRTTQPNSNPRRHKRDGPIHRGDSELV